MLRRLLVASVSVAAVAAPASAQALCANAHRRVDAAHVRSASAATVCLLNQQRRAHGLRPLRAVQPLGRPARHHSRDMVRHRFFAHGAFLGRLHGYFAHARAWQVGENIAWGGGRLASPAEIVDMWMHSPPHRENILTSRFRDVGIGIATGTPAGMAGGTWTADFGFRG